MWVQVRRDPLTFLSDETLPNFKKRKHPRKREKRNKGQGPKSRQADSPKEACQRGKRTTKY